MENIYNYTLNQLEEKFVKDGFKKFRAKQVFDWIYKKKITDTSLMGNIGDDVREYIGSKFYFGSLKLLKTEKGQNVFKYVFELDDSSLIEAVLMIHNYGNSLCVSTQVGCNMGCLFCESGKIKKVRNLEIAEIVEQILMIENIAKKRVSHIVVMGIGEPFDNYSNVVNFLDIINSDFGLAIGARHITVSTCGMVPEILEFSKLDKQYNLAISLHAATNRVRNMIMPINKAYNIESLIASLHKYVERTNRRVTIEYVMLRDVNDSVEDAIELSALLIGLNCYVNLIPYNKTESSDFLPSTRKNINDFYDILMKNGVKATVRKEFGDSISAACGQLSAKVMEG